MEINDVTIKFGKGNSVKDFYYYLILSDFTKEQLSKTIKVNQWWFDRLENSSKMQIKRRMNG